VLLPDAVWQRLRPGSASTPWSVLLHGEAPAAQPLEYSEIFHAVVDPEGWLYCLGRRDSPIRGDHRGEVAVWCMDADGVSCWARHLGEYGTHGNRRYGDGGLALLGDGRLMAWTPENSHAVVIDSEDGELLEPMGGPEPEGAEIHHLDLVECQALLGDAGGGLLAFMPDVENRPSMLRFVRYDEHGQGVNTWPEPAGLFSFFRREKPRALHDDDGDNTTLIAASKMKGRPTRCHASGLLPALGPDGSLYLLFADESQFTHPAMLSCFDPSGEKLWRVDLGFQAIGSTLEGLGVDAEGQAFVLLTDLKSQQRVVLLRVSPDGADFEEIAEMSTLAASNGVLVVGHDGTVHLFSGKARRIFTPEGRLSWRNDEARWQDQQPMDH